MIKFLKLMALVVLIFILTACSAISAGTVYEKVYTPAYSTTSLMCASYNSKGFCSVWLPITTQHPETWKLKIREGDETGWIYTTRESFDETEVGEYVYTN